MLEYNQIPKILKRIVFNSINDKSSSKESNNALHAIMNDKCKGKSLTKQQIFDLEFKYSNVLTKLLKDLYGENWYNYDASWELLSGGYDGNALSEEFIREFQDRIHWNKVSMCQNLSEDFIWEFRDKVTWVIIYHYQELSPEFIKKAEEEGYLE